MPDMKQLSAGRSRMDYMLLGAMVALVVLGALCVMSAVNSISWANAVVRTHCVALPVGILPIGPGAAASLPSGASTITLAATVSIWSAVYAP